MANQLYSQLKGSGLPYSSRLGGGGGGHYSDHSLAGASRYIGSDHRAEDASLLSSERLLYLNSLDSSRYSGASDYAGSLSGRTSLAGLDVISSMGESQISGIKRSSDALYHPSEALFATNALAKHPKFESTLGLPVYPQRPGEKDCPHYMMTRTCKFGERCKFDHPIWVPEGGIPDWKEIPPVPSSESLPVRPGEPDCPYYLKTLICKFGPRCKFNHPKIESAEDSSLLPERPTEPACSYYMQTGKCKFGINCKFHHPKDVQLSLAPEFARGEQNGSIAKAAEQTTVNGNVKPFTSFSPALLHNSKGLPLRPGEPDCSFYMKTGSCKFGASCVFNHPDRTAIDPSVVAANLPLGLVNPSAAAAVLSNIDPRLNQASLQLGSIIYPQRPGQIECDYYMKTGVCKFAERCKFHHPIDRNSGTVPSMNVAQQNLKLTLAGLPRREGAVVCSFYMKTGTCMFGSSCRFDHPPPGEAVAMAAGKSESSGEEEASDSGDGGKNKDR